MQILTPTHNDQLPAAFNDPAGNLLRPAQLSDHAQELKTCEDQLNNPHVQDKGEVRKRMSNLRKQYDSQAPRPITNGAVKDALAKEANDLLEQILPGMLSQEEMRKNPAGSVDKHLRWERKNKPKIIRWKKINCLLNADQSDPHTWDRDAANLERYRPQGPQDRFRTDAQIGGHMSYGRVPEENWEQAFGTTHPENSALNQAKRATETDPLRAAIQQAQQPVDVMNVQTPSPGLDVLASVPKPKVKRQMTEAQKATLKANLAKGREERRKRLAELVKQG